MPSTVAAVPDTARDQVQRARQHAADKRGAAACPADAEALAPRKDTRSWDYAWRSGVAGGLAGCAVSDAPLFPEIWTR